MQTRLSGMTIIDVLIGSAIFLIIFLALVTVLRTSVTLSTVTKAQAGATTLLASQMEYIRSLSYENVALTTATPPGAIAPQATTTYGGITYVLNSNITFVDDSHDGSGVGDLYGGSGDYKRVELTAHFDVHGSRSEKIVTLLVPTHIESSQGKGTLEIRAVTAAGLPVVGAMVRVTNAGTTPAFDTTVYTNGQGVALLGNVTPGTGYQVIVSRSGYSSAQTQLRTTANANPSKAPLSVEAGKTTKSTFVIDTLALLTVRTVNQDLSPRGNTTLTLRGLRTEGVSLSGVPIYTNAFTVTTNVQGTAVLSVPWDSYFVTSPSGASLTNGDEFPYQILPGASATIDISITP